MEPFFQYLVNGLANGSILILIAIGFNVIYESTGVINFAQGDFAMIGGLMVFQMAGRWEMNVFASAIMAIMIVCAFAATMNIAVIYPLRKSNIVSVIIATIGVSITLRAVFRIFYPEEAYNVPPFAGGNFNIAGVFFRTQLLWMFAISALAVLAIYLFFTKTDTGKALRACSINREAAMLVGVDVNKMSLIAFMIAGALGSTAGFISGTSARYGMGFTIGVKGFTAAVVGGLGNTFGAVFGGLFVGVIEEMVAGYISSGFKDAVSAMILILVLLLRPEGILGRRKQVKV